MRTLILNATNVVPNTLNDTYLYQFPNGAVNFDEEQIALATISFPVSLFNITSATYGMRFNNNVYQYIWIDGLTYTVNMPDGGYAMTTINAYLQEVMVKNGHYLVDNTISSAPKFVYYIELVNNNTFYAIQFNAYPVPTSLPANFSNPAGMLFPSTIKTPQIIVPSNNKFGKVIGFNPGTYPPAPDTEKYSKKSDFLPAVNPVDGYLISCNLLNNKYSLPSTLLYAFSTGSTRFGSVFVFNVPQFAFVDIQNGQYTNIQIQFLSQDQKRVALEDNNITMMFVIEKKQNTTK